jgi:[ribosomal protein S18]-alanine N-acetyltransferase
MKPGDILIKIADLQDYLPLSRFLEKNNIAAIIRYFHPFPLTLENAFEISHNIQKDRYYLAYLGKEIVGLSMLRGWDEGYDIPSFGILVDYEHCHQGIGKQLTVFTLSEAQRLGCKKVRLSVYGSNSNALHLYESLNFLELSREIVQIDDETDIKIVMVKELGIDSFI